MTKCECGGTLVEMNYNSELTCVKCGLVNQIGMLSDNIDDVPYDARDSYEEDKMNKKFTKMTEQVTEILIHCMGKLVSVDDTATLIVEVMNDTIENYKYNITGVSRWYLMALSIYNVGMYKRIGLSLKQICNVMNNISDFNHLLECRKVMAFLEEIQVIWLRRKWYRELQARLQRSGCKDKLSRVVYQLDFIEEDLKQKVLRAAFGVYDRVQAKFTVNKSYTLIYTTVLIGCRMIGIKIKKKDYCRKVNVSLPTLNQHEGKIQQILVKAQKK